MLFNVNIEFLKPIFLCEKDKEKQKTITTIIDTKDFWDANKFVKEQYAPLGIKKCKITAYEGGNNGRA